MLKPSPFALLALALLAGCATTADVDKAKASWHGATYDEVVAAWGQPASQTTLEGGLQGYTWISQSAGYGASVGAYGGSGGGGVGISLPLPGMGGMVRGQCQRTLGFKDGRVVDQIWQGTTQYCSIFGRF
ncbi:MAG: hypothetical protein GEV05_22120 [Betaproteobacteria bacterium]|nr:hypothetical protein [Betaproteobacteria bacterium]